MNFIVKKFNSKEYTLVEKLTEFGKDIIYHFIGDEDELFCLLLNNEYIIIKNADKIKFIKDQIYNYIEGIYFNIQQLIDRVNESKKEKHEISAREHKTFIAEQIELLKIIPEFNEKKATKRLKEIKIFTANKRTMQGYIAFYSSNEDAIYFENKDLKNEEVDARRTRLHEAVHAIITPNLNRILDRIVGRGLLEGATELIVEKIFGNSNIYLDMIDDGAIFNLSKECIYKSAVSILMQIEYIMGQDISEFALGGKVQIFLDFSKKYGKNLFRFLRCKTDRLINTKISDRKEIKILQELQNAILIGVFDKEFQYVNSIELANIYMKRLIKFQKMRTYIIGDNTFERYYCKKLQQIKQQLQNEGVSIEIINSFLEENKYEQYMKFGELPIEAQNKIKRVEHQKSLIKRIAASKRVSELKKRMFKIKASDIDQEQSI